MKPAHVVPRAGGPEVEGIRLAAVPGAQSRPGMVAEEDLVRARMHWVEIDHGAIAHNVRALQRVLGESKLWAVVKGDGYGHGAAEAARTALAAGAAGLTVSSLFEALDLRAAGVDGPLFVMNPALAEHADLYVKYRLIASVADEEAGLALSRAMARGAAVAGSAGNVKEASANAPAKTPTANAPGSVATGLDGTPGRGAAWAAHGSGEGRTYRTDGVPDGQGVAPWSTRIPVHVKVDTGLGRFGAPDDVVALIRRLHELPRIEVQGIFSHFASADEADQRSALGQLAVFNDLLDALSAHNIRPPVAHLCNSPGTLAIPAARLQMARSGLSVYGMYPSPSVRERAVAAGVELRPAMTLRARVASVRRLPAGSPIGYGSTYVTERETTVITLPVGYSNGVARNLTGKLEVLVHGQRRPVVGRVCMNHVMVDAGDLPVQLGDVVTLLGQDGDERIAAEEWAAHLGTIAYEIVCMVGSRNPRVHVGRAPG